MNNLNFSFLLVFISILSFCLTNPNEPLSFPITYENGLAFITLNFNDIIGFQLVPIDQTKNHSLISGFMPHTFNCTEEGLIEINSTSISIKKCFTNLGFSSVHTINIPEFEFLIGDIKKIDSCRSFYLGLGPIYRNIKTSPIHILKNKNVISKASYGFEFEMRRKKGSIYLGGIPSNKLLGKTVGKCKIYSTSYETWNCNLERTRYKNASYNNKYYSYFNIHESGILVPSSLFEFFENDVLDINGSLYCTVIVDFLGVFSFRCRQDFLLSLEKVNFVIDNDEYSIKIKDLFLCLEDGPYNNCDSYIIKDDKNKDTIIFGAAFLSNFITEFNYDDNNIIFVEKNGTIVNKGEIHYYEKNGPSSFGLFWVNVISLLILLLGVLLLIYIIKYIKE